jgi:hypothetical protein
MMYTYTVGADGREVMVLNLTAGYHKVQPHRIDPSHTIMA